MRVIRVLADCALYSTRIKGSVRVFPGRVGSPQGGVPARRGRATNGARSAPGARAAVGGVRPRKARGPTGRRTPWEPLGVVPGAVVPSRGPPPQSSRSRSCHRARRCRTKPAPNEVNTRPRGPTWVDDAQSARLTGQIARRRREAPPRSDFFLRCFATQRNVTCRLHSENL